MTKYEAEVTIELDVDGDDEAAFAAVDEIMQRAWDTDQGRTWQTQKWNFEMSGVGCIAKVADVYEETR